MLESNAARAEYVFNDTTAEDMPKEFEQYKITEE